MVEPRETDPLLLDVPQHDGWHVLPPVVLGSMIGQGGMGAVYSGHHMHLGIDVAVKCLKPGLVDRGAQFVDRFQREANLAAKITHQSLVRIYDYRQAYGLHYLVMELVDGESARARVARAGVQSEAEAAAILHGTAEALSAAHCSRERVIHRDVKPDNILVSHAGDVKLADLGIAKALDADETGALATIGVIGTPRYMAPEQWEGDAELGPQVDVWSLGATLYYLLVGEDAIRGQNQQQAYAATCQKPFPDVRERRPDVSEDMAFVLEKCVARNVEDRYRDAAELAAALRPWLDRPQELLQGGATLASATATSFARPSSELIHRIREQLQDVTPPPATGIEETIELPPTSHLAAPEVSPKGRRSAVSWALLAAALVVLSVWIVGRPWRTGPPTPEPDGSTIAALPHQLAPESSTAKGEPESSEINDQEPAIAAPRSKAPEQGADLGTTQPHLVGPAKDPAQVPAQVPAQSPAEGPAGGPAKGPAATPTENLVEKPADEPAGRGEQSTPAPKTAEQPSPEAAQAEARPVAATTPSASPVLRLDELELVDGVHYCSQSILSLRGVVQDHTPGVAPNVTLNGSSTPCDIIRSGRFRAEVRLPQNAPSRIHVSYASGNEVELQVVQDSRNPVIERIAPAATALTVSDSELEVSVRVTELNLRRLLMNGKAVEPSAADPNVFTAIMPLPTDGTHRVLLRAEDLSGRRVSQTLMVLKDSKAPRLLAQSNPAAGERVVTDAEIKIQLAFSEPLSSYTWAGVERVVDPRGAKIEFLAAAPSVAGPWVLRGTATDFAGNSAEFQLELVAEAEQVRSSSQDTAPLGDAANEGDRTPDPSTLPEVAGSSTAAGDGSEVPVGWELLQRAKEGRWAMLVKEPRTGLTFRLIRPGTFEMGSPSREVDRRKEERQRMVTLTQPYYLAITETSQEQFARITGRSPSKFRGPGLPVDSVNWDEAAEFCRSIGCELPTEAQWEYACRAGTQTPSAFGSELRGEFANFLGASSYPRGKSLNRRRTVRADGADEDQIRPNLWGFYHMHGNVFEWCRDVYRADAYDTLPTVDPIYVGPGEEHVIRGGSWATPGWDCRSASRNLAGDRPQKPSSIGFRCSLTLPADDQ